MYREKKKRNIIIIVLLALLFCITAGYSAFLSKLTISGSSTITSNWDVEITNVTNGTASGTAENAVTPTWDKLTANMEANLYKTGDAMEYDVTIENKGTIDAKLDTITTNLTNSNSDAVNITFSGYTKGEQLLKGTSKTVHVKIAYNPSYTGGETSGEVDVNFNYTQKTTNPGTGLPTTDYLLTYDYATNGGTSATLDKEYLEPGNNANLANTAVKSGYTFVGWNTDKDAQVGLSSYQMPSSNTTLYAIYSKTLVLTYAKGTGVESIGKNSDTCTIYNNIASCNVTLPTITQTQYYTILGWYNGETKVGDPNGTYALASDITLTAKAQEPEPLMQSWTDSSTSDFHSSTYKTKIKSVEILTNKTVPNDAVASWDVSANQNNSVMAWVINDPNNSGYYKLYIGGNGGVIANPDSSYIFTGFSATTSINLNNLDTSRATNMNGMFAGCNGLTSLNISNFDTSKVTNMSYMFINCSGLTSLNVSNFDTSKVTNMSSMFSSCSGLTSLNVSNFNTSNVTAMNYMFQDCSGLTSLDVSNFNTSKVTDMSWMFLGCSGLTSLNVSNFNTSNVTNMDSMFQSCSGLTSLNISNFDTSNVTNMDSMFYNCGGLTSLDLSNFDTSNVTNMGTMFWACSGLTSLNVSNFDTSKVTNMYGMFDRCSGLTSLNVSNFNTSNVTSMFGMFSDCSGLTSLDLSNFNTSNVTDMKYMFSGCSGLTNLDVSNFDTSNVTNMYEMFYLCSSLRKLKLCSFNTSAVTSMNSMFQGTTSLQGVYVGPSWTTANATTASMFTSSGVSAVSQSATCEADAEDPATISLATSKTTNNINVVATASAPSGITKYEFSKDSGTTWIDNGTNNAYNFSGLTRNTTYPIKVRVTSTIGKLTTTNVTNVTTDDITLPTFTESGTTSKTVTITYPAGCGSTYTCSYVKDGGTSVNVTSTTTSVTFTNSGTLVASVSDGSNTVSNSYTVTANKTVTYDYATNGGTSATQTSAIVGEGNAIDLTPTATKSGWTFVGWNTSSTATTGLSSLNMGTSNVTLYAIYTTTTSRNFVLQDSNAATMAATTSSCTLYNKSTSCTITAPTLTAKTGYTALGYNTSSSATTSSLSSGGSITINVGTSGTYYSITKNNTALTATFNGNGATVGSASQSCYKYNGASTCNITTPSITRSGFTITGYNTSAGATTSTVGANASLSLSANATYYAITKKVITITYAKGSNVSAIGTTSGTCTIQNSSTSCSVTTPSITANTGYTSVGWNTTNGATTGTAAGSSITGLSANATYYANAVDNTIPTVSLSPSTQSSYTNGTAVTVTLADSGSGISASQNVYYAWSTSSTTAPSYSSYVTSTNTAGAKTTTVTIPATASSSLTGTYYLWIKAGNSDVAGNLSAVKTSGSFTFDSTSPSLSFATSKTTNSITITATASALSGITKYEYSKDGGTTWVTGTNNTYTFSGLTKNTAYSIKVRVTSGVSKVTTSSAASVTTNDIALPTFTESGTTTKTVTITYPAGCGSTYTCSYVKDGGTSVNVTSTTTSVTFTNSGTLVASVSDGTNSVSNSYTVTANKTVTYDYATNGGTSATQTSAIVSEGSLIDLSPTATKSGWTFVGWNTSSTATTGLSSLNMGTSNVTLYAIYKKEAKTITITFNRNSAVSQTPSGGSANTSTSLTQSCTIPEVYNNATQNATCNITSPTITPTSGYSVIGYNTSASGTTSNWNQTTENAVSSNTTYYAIIGKIMTATYVKGTGVDAIGKTSDTCTAYNSQTTCTLTLPTITQTQYYTILGWYNGETKVGDPNGTYALTSDITLTAKAQEPEPLMQSWTYNATSDFHSSTYITKIKSAEILTNKTVPTDAVASWDVSANQNNSVMAWVINDPDNSGYYKLYIGGNGGVIANPDSSDIFNNFSEITSINLTNLDTSRVTNMEGMFNDCSSLTNLNVSNFNTSNVTNMGSMVANCYSLTSLNVSNFNTSNVTNMEGMFQGCSGLTSLNVSNFDTSRVTGMDGMFFGCSGLTSLNVSNFNTSKVTDMRLMFTNCSSLTNLNVSNFNTSNVTNMGYMFMSCSGLTSLNVSNFDTSKVTDMTSMFGGCSDLTTLNVSNFNTSNVTNMSDMFSDCSGLTSLDLSNFNTFKVMDMSDMFYGCSGLTSLNVSNFDTSKVTTMNSMFKNCRTIRKLKLCSFNTSTVTNMNSMFYGTTNLQGVYVGPSWTSANATTTNMFTSSGVSAVSQSTTCEADAEDPATISLATSKTTKSINVVATASAESGIAKYEFSKDSGTTWIDNGTNNTYSFSGLTKNTAYPIKVRVTSTIGKLTTTDVTNVTTNNIATPTFAESGTTTKTITITYPAGCGSTLTCSYVKDGGTSVSVTSTTTSVTFTASGSLVANVTDGTNNVSSSYTANLTQIYNFTYTGQVQTFTAPEAGQYQIEAWGAQGGLSGGAGGYAIGKINLTSGQILYIVVGGQGGGSGNTYAGGYNGGGEANYTTSYPSSAGGGGGATHVAKVTGLLSTLSSQTSQVVIVAGGGGGQSENTTSTCGVGGGITGTNATAQYYGGGGSQTTGGTKQCDNATAGSFGQGGHAETLTDTGSSRYYGGGGGGGYYGGGGGCWSGTITLSGSGGGGSGYIGNSDLTSKHMTCYNCTTSTDTATKTQTTTNVSSTPTSDYAKNGNGYIRITYYK